MTETQWALTVSVMMLGFAGLATLKLWRDPNDSATFLTFLISGSAGIGIAALTWAACAYLGVE